MNITSLLKNGVSKKKLIIWLMLFLAIFVLVNYRGMGAKWVVLEPEKITLVGAGGTHVTVQGDYRMDSESVVLVKEWLEANGFQRNQAEEKKPGTTSYQGVYKRSLPVTVTLEANESPETTSISLMYHGSGLKWFLDKKIQMVEMFSNELIKQGTKGTVDVEAW